MAGGEEGEGLGRLAKGQRLDQPRIQVLMLRALLRAVTGPLCSQSHPSDCGLGTTVLQRGSNLKQNHAEQTRLSMLSTKQP